VRTLLEQKHKYNRTICPISYCHKEGLEEVVEKLPDAGTYVRFRHNDGTEHGWGVYNSISDLGKAINIKYNPKRMHCPKCGKIGIINSWRPKEKEPWIVKYYIRHGKITYGEGNYRKQDRCMIEEQIHRDLVLKRLNRYISPSPVVNITLKVKPVILKPRKYVRRHRVNCPRCHKRGRLDRAPVSSKTPEIKRFYIDHKRVNKQINRCYMRQGEETELAERIWSR